MGAAGTRVRRIETREGWVAGVVLENGQRDPR